MACNFEPVTTATSIKVLTSFWPTKDIDPKKLSTAGDWSILQNLYSNLVEVSAAQSVRPALAESWTQSPDGLIWIFSLRNNLRWSDGSPMTSSEITASLKRSIQGTVHTKVGPYLKSIEAIPENKIKFVLKSLPENFLTNLAFVDFAVVHPKSYKSDFSWDVKSSGPYRVANFSDKVITLEENIYYWDKEEKRPKNVTMVRAKGNMDDIKELVDEHKFNAGQLPLGLVTTEDQLTLLKKYYDVLYGNMDFNALFMFSKKRTKEKSLKLDLRRYLLCQTQKVFWNGRETHPQRATGLRPPGVRGALSVKEFEEVLAEVCSDKKTAHLPKKLELLVADTEENRPLLKEMIAALRSTGITIVDKVIPKINFYSEFDKGDFDLAMLFLGASEDDPDSSWRIYQNDYAEPPSDEELNAAQIEKDPVKRNEIYKEIERI